MSENLRPPFLHGENGRLKKVLLVEQTLNKMLSFYERYCIFTFGKIWTLQARSCFAKINSSFLSKSTSTLLCVGDISTLNWEKIIEKIIRTMSRDTHFSSRNKKHFYNLTLRRNWNWNCELLRSCSSQS